MASESKHLRCAIYTRKSTEHVLGAGVQFAGRPTGRLRGIPGHQHRNDVQGFRSFGTSPQSVTLPDTVTALWGGNSQGKTSLAEALERVQRRRLGKFPGGFTFLVLHRGSRKECAEVEKRYRPTEDIGWNTSKGGGRWRGLSDTDNPQENANMKRFDVPVRCIEPAGIEPVTVTVFSGSKQGAREAATEKMKDKYLRHQNLETKWVVAGEPVEGRSGLPRITEART